MKKDNNALEKRDESLEKQLFKKAMYRAATVSCEIGTRDGSSYRCPSSKRFTEVIPFYAREHLEFILEVFDNSKFLAILRKEDGVVEVYVKLSNEEEQRFLEKIELRDFFQHYLLVEVDYDEEIQLNIALVNECMSFDEFTDVIPNRAREHEEFILGLVEIAKFSAILSKEDETVVKVYVKFNNEEKLRFLEEIGKDDFVHCYSFTEKNQEKEE